MTEDLLIEVKNIKVTVNEQLEKLVKRQGLFQDIWKEDFSEKSFVAKEAYETLIKEFKDSLNILDMLDINSSNDFVCTVEKELTKSGNIINKNLKILEIYMNFIL